MTKTVLLGDICIKVTSGGTPSTKHNEYYGGVIPWLRTQEVNFSNIYSTEKTITEVGLKNSSAKLIPENSVIIAMYGATAGKSAISKIPLTTNQACCNLIIDSMKADYRYVYYYLVNSYSKLLAAATGAAQQNLGTQQITKMEVELPDIEVQKKIANILSSLDEKIELNRKMNETLEQIGQALFRHYFVDNVEAENVKVTDLLSFERGVEPGSKSYSELNFENSRPFLRVGDLSQRKSSIFVDKSLLKNKFVKPNEILVSFDGNPGLVAVGLEGAYSTGIRKVVLKDNKLSTGYAYFLMKSDDIKDTIDRYSEGTTIKHAPRAIENMTTKIPKNTNGMMELQNILDTLVSNLMQIQTLTTLRDTLLPRLISGKIEL